MATTFPDIAALGIGADLPLADASPSAILIIQDGLIVYANAAASGITGYPPEELLGRSVRDLATPEFRPLIEERKLLRKRGLEVPKHLEMKFLTRDQQERWIDCTFNFLTLQGKPTTIANGIDITERKQAEQALRQAEQKYRDIFENAVEGIFQTTPNGRFITANPALARILGYDSPDELLNSRTDIARQHYVDPVQRNEFKRQLEEYGVVRDFEHLAYRKDGRKIWLTENVRSVCDDKGAVLYYEGFTEDITARKHAEQEQEKSLITERQARLQAVVMRDANLAITQDLNLERVLETLLEYLRKLVPYDSANVMLLEDSKFVVSALSGYENFRGDLNVVRTLSFDAKSNSIIAEICSSHRSVLITDTEHEGAWERVPGAEHARNWIGVPLIAYGKTIGLYSLDKTQPGFFTPEHMRLAESLAAPAASAIANARLFQLGRQNAEELEQRIVERERIAMALRESESFRRTIIESEPECVKLVGPDYAVIDINPAGLAMFGAGSKEQVIGQSVLSLVAPEWRYSYMAMHERVLSGESVISEFEMIGPNGERRRVETHAAPLRDSISNVIAQLAITRDITERKNAEESLNIFRNLIDQSTDAIEVLDPNTMRYIDCNTAAHQTLGYTREEFLSMRAFDIDPVIDKNLVAQLNQEMEKFGFVIFESVHRRKDGSTFQVEINVKNIRLEKDYRLAIVRDITERKRSEERLQEYEKVVEGLDEMIVVVDRNYRYLLANQAYLNYRNVTRKEVIGRVAAEVAGNDVFEQSIRKHLDECFQGKVVRYEMTDVYPTLGERHLSVSYFPIDGPHGIDRAACVLSDITEQKRAQESLMQSESQLAEAQRLASIGSWDWDIRNGAISWSDELFRIFGMPPQEIKMGKQAFEFIHPDDRDLVMSSVETAIKTKEDYSLDYRICRPDGVERILHTRGHVLCDEHGEPARVFGATQDVTEHQQALTALRRAEEKYRQIFENAGEGIFQSTPDGRYIVANPTLAAMYGFDSPQELIRSRTDIACEIYCDPKRREEFKDQLEEFGVVRDFEHQVFRKDGSKIWIAVNARVVRNNEGEVLYYEGTVQEISERKRAETRSEIFSHLARKLSGARTQLAAGRIIADSAYELFGWDSCNLHLYDAENDIIHPLLNVDTINGRQVDITVSTITKPSARSKRVIDHGPELILREQPVKFDDDSIPFGDKARPSASLMTVPICHADNIIGLLSIHSYDADAYDESDLRDLHALATYCGEAVNRVRIEESLRVSEERYRELFESAKDAYYVHDLQGRYISVNRAAENLAGLSREQIIGRKFSDFIAPEHLTTVSEKLCRKLIEEGETDYETEVVASDGRRVPVEVSSHLIYENGVAVRVQGTARNITERKRAEAALRQSEREYRGLFENARDAILIIDPEQEIVLAVNQRACEVYGISRSEFVGISLQTISNNVERGRMVIKETLEHGMAHDFETIQRRGDGTEMFLHINASVVEYKGRIAIQSINRDITEQKRAQDALQSYPRQLIEAQEAERQSVARELHDQIGQVLTAIHLNLQAVRKTCETTEACVLIDEGVAIVDEALGQVRNLSFELRPSLLDDLGLAAALRWYTDRFTQRTGIQAATMINLPDSPARLTKELETACFRIAQEALTNVVRHSQAKNVAVRLQKLNDQIRLSVKDDGVGFAAHSQNLAPFTTHLGLRGMRERALALGGQLEVSSSHRGTRISASFPDENKKEDRYYIS
jgi:PAS domain S-box-containing protein